MGTIDVTAIVLALIGMLSGWATWCWRLLAFCGIDRPVCLYDPEVGDNVYRPLYEVASSKLARKTHVDMLNKVQINYYAAGLHREGSKAVFRYTSLELSDRFALLNAAFGEEGYRV